jgi:hypothetical protein
MDTSKVYAPSRELQWSIVLVAELVLAQSMLVIGLIFRRPVSRYYRDRAESADSLMKQSKYLDIALKSIGDAVISTDVQRRVVSMNPVRSLPFS